MLMNIPAIIFMVPMQWLVTPAFIAARAPPLDSNRFAQTVGRCIFHSTKIKHYTKMSKHLTVNLKNRMGADISPNPPWSTLALRGMTRNRRHCPDWHGPRHHRKKSHTQRRVQLRKTVLNNPASNASYHAFKMGRGVNSGVFKWNMPDDSNAAI
ncbi:MAG: hypothetical protein OXC66_10485 [Roseovarius sp.]|nr:hypothetical protein [Roseovarius sp.]